MTQVSTQTSIIEMVPEYLQQSDSSADEGSKALQWDVFKAMTGIWGEANFVKSGLADHLNTTKDTTDYLWYTTRLVSFWKKTYQQIFLSLNFGIYR